MQIATFRALRLLFAGSSIFILSKLDTEVISRAFLELFVVGRLPFTEIVVSYEAIFAGMVFFGWLIITYNFAIFGLARLSNELQGTAVSEEIDNLAL